MKAVEVVGDVEWYGDDCSLDVVRRLVPLTYLFRHGPRPYSSIHARHLITVECATSSHL